MLQWYPHPNIIQPGNQTNDFLKAKLSSLSSRIWKQQHSVSKHPELKRSSIFCEGCIFPSFSLPCKYIYWTWYHELGASKVLTLQQEQMVKDTNTTKDGKVGAISPLNLYIATSRIALQTIFREIALFYYQNIWMKPLLK